MLLLLVTGIKLESGSKGIEPASYTCLLSKVQAVTAVHAKHGQGRVIRARHRSGGVGSETLVGPGTRGRHVQQTRENIAAYDRHENIPAQAGPPGPPTSSSPTPPPVFLAVSEGGRKTGGGVGEELVGAGGPCLSRDVFVAIVSRNVLSCLLNVPAAGPWAYKCFRSLASRPVSGPDYPPLAVFCMDCGYCLNFGKQTGVGGRLNSF